MISENTKAILLLTCFFTSNEVRKFKTFSINEYGYFACWLNQNGFTPVDLLSESRLDDAFSLWEEPLSHVKAKQMVGFSRLDNTISNITYKRVQELLGRGASLSLALEKWQSAGVWIMDRQHHDYPAAFKKKLKHQSPALLFGVGNSSLLSQKSIGFVGSRDCTVQDESATKHYVEQINALGYQVVSGGAKGVDTCSMLASLNTGHAAIGVVADSLFRASASSQWRQHLKNDRLVLISPFYPEGRFTPANAMARNKYIYLLSQATVVVTSGENGGTWEGAKENLKKGWVRLLVSKHQEPLKAGNRMLLDSLSRIDAMAKPISINDSTDTISHLICGTEVNEVISLSSSESTGDLFSLGDDESEQASVDDEGAVQAPAIPESLPWFGEQFIENERNETNSELKQPSEDSQEQKVTAFTSEIVNDEVNDSLEENCLGLLVDTPLLKQFYLQLVDHIGETTEQLITKEQLEKQFPEFEIMGKTALDKWLKHMVELGLLVKPHAKKKEYMLPANAG